MSVRRHADPSAVRYVWDAIKLLNSQNETADLSKIVKYLSDEIGYTIEIAKQCIKQVLLDKLILEDDKDNTNSKAAFPNDVYKIPYQELIQQVSDDKDWYCIECHLAGSVVACSSCHRVFHAECSQSSTSFTSNTLKFLNDKVNFNSNYSIFNPATVFNQNGNVPDIFNMDSTASSLENSIFGTNATLNSTTSSEINMNGEHLERLHLCSVCKISKSEEPCSLQQQDLNYLLGFILERIKSWLPINLMHKMDPEQQQKQWPNMELEWRANQLWFEQINMAELERKLKSNEYTKLGEFQADVIAIRHNIAIFHGIESQEYGAAELMLHDCCHELSELRLCADCYRHSNEKLNSNWFCLPCKNPHKLVWAKQKGYPHWPAKIIKATDSVYDVRFFGGKYERSILPKSSVKPIETPTDKLHIKHNAGFKKSLDELHLHQILLKDEAAVEKLISDGKRRKEQKKKRRNSSLSKSPNKKPLIQVKRDIYEFPDGHEKLAVMPKPATRKSLSPVIKSAKNKKAQQEISDVVSIPDDDEITIIQSSPMKSTDITVEQVTSSTEYIIGPEDNSIENQMQELEKPYSDAVEKMRRQLEDTNDKNELIIIAMNSMREEIDRVQAEHAEQLRKLVDEHAIQVTETKRKQWCYNCQQDAIYHCCWNTAYCSPACQQQHWQAEHKKVCRRKR